MAVDKRIKYEDKGPVIQGGVQNYLGKQPQVMAPRKWKSAPDKPATELAYITEAEKKLIMKADIHGGLERGPNMGPSGIMSLDSFGDADAGMSGGLSGGDVSAAESGSSFAGADTISDSYGAGLRGGYIASGAGSGSRLNEPQSVLDVAKGLQSKYNFNPNRGSGMFGNVVSGIMGLINPLAGLFTRGINYARQNLGPTFDRFKNAPTLDRALNPDKYVNQPYVIGSNPMDTQRFNKSQFGQTYDYPEYNKLQKEYEEKINRDLLTNPETEIFDLTGGGINSLRSTLEVPNFDISNLYADASLRNTLENILNPNLNIDKALDKEEEKRQREQELLQELRNDNLMARKSALEKIEYHEKICRLMQRQTFEQIQQLKNQIIRIERILIGTAAFVIISLLEKII
jgi:hypothetical protein